MKNNSALRSIVLALSAVLASSSGAFASDTCIAIRGNGELMPSHWSALAHTVETYGTPRAIAGGSSGSLSAFLLESVIANPLVAATTDENARALKAAYLLKSIEGIVEYVGKQKNTKALMEIIRNFQHASATGELSPYIEKIIAAGNNPEAALSNVDEEIKPLLALLGKISGNADPADALAALRTFKDTQLLFGPGVMEAYADFQVAYATKGKDLEALANFRAKALILRKTISVLGKFDAKNDKSLLLRPGVINFRALGILFGRMADFYALAGSSADFSKEVEAHLAKFATVKTAGVLWSDLPATSRNAFEKLFAKYDRTIGSKLSATAHRINAPVSSAPGFSTFVTTAVATGASVKVLKDTRAKFYAAKSEAEGDAIAEGMRINEKNIRFGYWGAPRDLSRMGAGFKKRDAAGNLADWQLADKSQRFLALGQATWADILERSPAEPGLASFLPLDATEKSLSLGGWSDLHPTLALKAFGCKYSIYVTRSGLDTPFGQGVTKRLFNISDQDIPWERLDPPTDKTITELSAWMASASNSLWSRMYNLSNPNSSFSQSLTYADAVVCTNWNGYDVKSQFGQLIANGYQAPIFERTEGLKELRTGLVPKFAPESRVNTNDRSDLSIAGCLPYQSP